MALITIVDYAFTLYSIILLARVLISWFSVDPYNPIVRVLHQLTEPLLAPIRRLLPQTGAIDFSPLIGFVVIVLAQRIVIGLLLSLVR
jgi:YggT family protein